jgi:hypothetical protein
VEEVPDHLRQHPQSAEHPDQRCLPPQLEQVDLEQRLPSNLPIGLNHYGDRIGDYAPQGMRDGSQCRCDTRNVWAGGGDSPAGDGGDRAAAAVDLYWLPLGACGHFVRLNRRMYEAVAARLQRRPACDLYHSALQVEVPGAKYVIEQAPVHDWSGKQRGVSARARSEVCGQADFGSSATRSVFGSVDTFRTLPKP